MLAGINGYIETKVSTLGGIMNLNLVGEPTCSVKEMMTRLEENGIPVTINGDPADQAAVLVIVSAMTGPTKTSKSYMEKLKGKNISLAGILLTDVKKVDDKELLELVYLETIEQIGSVDESPTLLLSKDKDLIYKVKTLAANPSHTFPSSTFLAPKKPWWKFW